MQGRTTIEQILARGQSLFLITALASVAVFFWWLAPKNLNHRNSAINGASINVDEEDAVLQQAASRALGEREGTIIVMDPQTGRLRAVVNSRLAFEQAFSPGSTIKLFTALAAMQKGLINEESRLLCQTPYVKDDFEISCSHPKISAPFHPVQAIAYSCNYYFGKLGERLDEDSFNATLHSFGFGAPTSAGGELEARGSLPRGAQLVASNMLGEGKELLVTPIQLLTACAALINGGHLYTPQLAPTRDFDKRERAVVKIAPEHLASLIKGMRGAVVYGTAERAALSRLPLYLFGKTGTSTASDNLHTQGWFVGFASTSSQTPIARPESIELAVLVFIKNAHGADCAESARPVFDAFIRHRSRSQTIARVDEEATRLSSSSLASLPASHVRIHLEREDRTVTLPLEDYVLGVLAAEGAIEDEFEALKALAVAVRTYAFQNLKRHEHEGYDFCNTTHCQRYTFLEDGETKSASDPFRRARDSTAGEVLLDENGQMADAYFHAACGGMTANIETLWGSIAPRHLRGVRDPFCASMPHYEWTDVIPATRLMEALRSDSRTDVGVRLLNVMVSRRDATGRAELITLAGDARRRVVRGWDFKIIVGRALGWNLLKSSRFEVTRAGQNFIFRGGGFGHGVGLCQEGAHVMAHRGTSYRQILNYYFPGTSVGARARELDEAVARESTSLKLERHADAENAVSFKDSEEVETWKASLLTRGNDFKDSVYLPRAFNSNAHRPPVNVALKRNAAQNRRLSLTSEHFRLSYPASIPERDAESVLHQLEAARADVLRRMAAASLRFDAAQKIEVTVHTTTGDFVSMTGQPPWAAGATKGRRIELQPLGILRRRGVLHTTLRHEYAHAMIDVLSRGRAPRWLAEGLAIYVAGEGAMLARFAPKEGLPIDVIEQKLTRSVSAQEMRALYAAAYRQVQALIRSEGESSVWRRVAQN